MTSWAVLLIASVLLVAPGLAFSGLTPESHDQATAHLCDGDELCQGLDPEGSPVPGVRVWRLNWSGGGRQGWELKMLVLFTLGDLLLQGEELGLLCGPCRMIMQHLMDKLGDQPDENTVIEAASKVCGKMGPLKGLCKSITKRFLRRIAADITAGKTSRVVCEDIKMCKSKPVGFI
ncbi:antimicrobial peptide NK-lysin-like [Bos indicus]|uniref:Antimicrobial peptide NK-lysin-like n=1 Tax=Bos indicus TaxID=9915 RepID=A0ABM4T799_BOSIN